MRAGESALLTDLYQLTMAQGYLESGMAEPAAFEFFVRLLPPDRGFLVAAGLETLLEYLENLHFSDEDLNWLAESGRFSNTLIDYLRDFRFTGDVDAMPEGTVCFTNEPLVRVVAPITQAQLVESRLINLIHFQTLVASKAARCVLAAPGKRLVDFGMRRAHGAEAALLAARASYLAGFTGTATTLAAPRFDIPVFGTMAHSFVLAHQQETEAFEHFAAAQPDNVVFLIDTYDTEEAARKVVELGPRLHQRGIAIKAVRIDSGDLAAHARAVRAILDKGGLNQTGIFASGNLDEYAVRRMEAQGAPIDGYGVGTRLDTSADAPYLDSAYKLQEYAGTPRRKRSESKSTWPGRKQVYRWRTDNGEFSGDLVALTEESHDGEPLLRPVMRDGKRVVNDSLEEARARCGRELLALPAHLRRLETVPPYRVAFSEPLQALAERLDQEAH